MLVQAVDLAAVAWAQCLSRDGEVIDQTCAWFHPSETSAVSAITAPFSIPSSVPDVVVIEDQPHNVRWDTTAKNVARMQGRIIERLSTYGAALDKVLFVQPLLWQRAVGVARLSPAETAQVATHYGYTPPDLLTMCAADYETLKGRERQAVRSKLRKLMTDYVDAFLVSVWAHNTYAEFGTFDVPSTQRYTR